jgi:hypothetical protein
MYEYVLTNLCLRHIVACSCSVACFKLHQTETCKANPAIFTQSNVAATNVSITNASAGVTQTTMAASTSVPSMPSASTISKASSERVCDADLERLATTPAILSALNSIELQNILRRIDGGGIDSGSAATDEQRVATLEKYRTNNSDFEAFIQNVLQVINKE